MKSMILKAATKVILGLIILFSLYILFRGHNAPGGGFIGALIAGAGFALYKYACGIPMIKKSLIIRPDIICILGLTCAILSGSMGLISHQPFLTGIWSSTYLAGETKWPLSTILFFDIGVYFTVLGMVLTLLITIEEDE